MRLRSASVMIVIAMYTFSFSLVAVQDTLLDPLGLEFTAPLDDSRGISDITALIDEEKINEATANMIRGTNGTDDDPGFDPVIDSLLSGAYSTVELIKLMSGTYVFNVLIWLGIDPIWVNLFVFLYILFLAWTIINLRNRS